MAIVQDAYFMPNDIETGLATGLYCRFGSVVRYATGPNKGQIVKHLQPIDLNATEQAKSTGVKVLQFVTQHKKGTIITIVSVAALSTGICVYRKVKNHEPKVVTEYRSSLKVYIDAIQKGSMDIHKIDNLIKKLEELKEHKDYEKISIQLTTKELEVLVSRIYEYTVKLADDNKFELTEEELHASSREGVDTIVNLQTYLKTQKRVFEETA